MVVDFRLPQKLSRSRINGVHVRAPVTDNCGVTSPGIRLDASYRDRRANGSRRLKVPMDAACAGIQRINRTALRTDENPAANDRGIGISAEFSWKTESPF